MSKASALSLRERVAEGRVRVRPPSPALRAPSPGGRGLLPFRYVIITNTDSSALDTQHDYLPITVVDHQIISREVNRRSRIPGKIAAKYFGAIAGP